jgi:hypothetical protein
MMRERGGAVCSGGVAGGRVGGKVGGKVGGRADGKADGKADESLKAWMTQFSTRGCKMETGTLQLSRSDSS